jgi:hypothetical protein
MRGPDFIIAGAPKCGTTALYEYLQTHPSVFLTNPKEPHFYADDLGAHREVPTWREYEQLFAGVTSNHQAVGEASVWYMHSKVALKRVREELPNARLIVILRQPIDFLRSLHSDMVWICFDDEPDFEKAWDLQEERRAGHRIPSLCQVPWFLDYRTLGQLSVHMSRLLQLFPREQVKIMLFDDFKASPQRVYENVLEFLQLPSDGRNEFPRVNASKRNRLAWLARCQATVVRTLPRSCIQVGKKFGLGQLNRTVTRLNSQPSSPVPLRDEFRQRLLEEFRRDIDALSELIGRDLNHWKE